MKKYLLTIVLFVCAALDVVFYTMDPTHINNLLWAAAFFGFGIKFYFDARRKP